MASSNNNLTLKVNGSLIHDTPFSLTFTSILWGTHNNEKQFICPLKFGVWLGPLLQLAVKLGFS